jgi:hypothetical protein
MFLTGFHFPYVPGLRDLPGFKGAFASIFGICLKRIRCTALRAFYKTNGDILYEPEKHGASVGHMFAEVELLERALSYRAELRVTAAPSSSTWAWPTVWKPRS